MNKNTFQIGIAVFSLIALSAAVVVFLNQPEPFRGTAYEAPYPPAPEIALTRADGSLFRLSEQKDKIVLLFFGYTACPDVCPTTLAEMKLVMDELGGQAESVRVVFVAVDPERDTPQKIQTYASHFRADFIGLSGSLEEMQKIWAAYGVFRKIVPLPNSSTGYAVDHTARVTLIDAEGNLRLSYGFQTPYKDIAHDVRLLLQNRK